METYKQIECEDRASETASRAGIYTLLSEIYRDVPSESLLNTLRAPAFAEALREAGLDLEVFFFSDTLSSYQKALAVEYTRLFVGPGKHLSLFESVHREGQLWGQTTIAVIESIRAGGLYYEQDDKNFADHLSVALEFMAHLLKREVAALRAGDLQEVQAAQHLQNQFLNEHLSRWLPTLCDAVIVQSRSPFYREMAKLTQDFMTQEFALTKMQDVDNEGPTRYQGRNAG